MKVFISQPMKDKTKAEVMAERVAAIEHLHDIFSDKELGFLDSWIENTPPEGCASEGAWYLAKSIEILSGADLVVFLHGWNTTRGCRLEELIANSYGINCIFL